MAGMAIRDKRPNRPPGMACIFLGVDAIDWSQGGFGSIDRLANKRLKDSQLRLSR